MKKILITFFLVSCGLYGSFPQQGPNRLQPAPVLKSAVNNNGIITVSGTLSTYRRCATFVIQFFGNPVNRNPITEGADLLGQITITTNNQGVAPFTAILQPTQSTDSFMSATATAVLENGTYGDTSEFSPNIVIS